MGRGALGGAALSPRALLPERQQPSQVRQNLKMVLLPFVMDIMVPVEVVVVNVNVDDSIIPLFFSSNCPASRVTWFCARTQGFKELCFKDHSSSFAKHCTNYKTDLLKVRFCPVFPLLKIILTSPKKLINR